ncbi:hypothetical protein Btru_012401 [Bulinus truncatus]|nr:hypothetical protein Btru_012401 [Bulinus truncatus]
MKKMFTIPYPWKHRKVYLSISVITLCMVVYNIGSHTWNVNDTIQTMPYNVEGNLRTFNQSFNLITGYVSERGRLDGAGNISSSRRENVPGNDKNSLQVLKEGRIDPATIRFLSQPIINYHEFQYIHNHWNFCHIHEPEVLITVPSAPSNFERRLTVRSSRRELLANDSSYNIKMLFFIGRTSSEEVQQKIDLESKEHGDIIQEEFDDTYHNIRYKAVSILKWVSTLCQNIRYVIRTDDDVKIDVPPMIEKLRATSSQHDNFILGEVKYGDVPARHPRSKWYLPKAEFPDSKLPPYALGGALGYPILTVQLLHQAALRVPPVWLDDLYITGICAPKVGARLITDPAFKFEHTSPYHFHIIESGRTRNLLDRQSSTPRRHHGGLGGGT